MSAMDPLHDTSDAQRELFKKFVQAANQHPSDQVMGAAANLLINALRQLHPSKKGALLALEEIMANTRGVLAEHYDGLGRRRSVFPYHQVVTVPKLDLRHDRG